MAHCDCLLFCALEILLLTYLLTSLTTFCLLLLLILSPISFPRDSAL